MDLFIIILLFVLFLGTTFSSLAELSISSVNPLRIRNLAEKGSAAARTVLWMREHTDLMFGTLLVANTIINVIIPVLMLRLFMRLMTNLEAGWIDAIAVVIATAFISLLEITAKTMGTARAEKFALMTAIPVKFILYILYPAVFLFNLLSNRLSRLFGVNPKFEGYSTSLDEVRLAIRSAAEQGHVNDTEHRMLQRLSFLGELQARHVLVPRSDVAAFKSDLSCREVAEKIIHLPHSRYLVYRDSMDDIIGILHARDLLECLSTQSTHKLTDILHPARFVPPSAPLGELLKLMRTERIQIVVVVDEYGQTEGIVTFEDIIEEVIGEIEDEYDDDGARSTQLEDGSLVLSGRESIRSCNSEYSLDLPLTTVTIGGLVLSVLGRLPKTGDKIRANGYELEVVKMSGRKIAQVAVRKIEPEDAETLGDEFE